MKRLLFVFIVIHSILGANAQFLEMGDPSELGMNVRRLEHLTRVMNEYVDAGKLPGAELLIARGGKIAYWETFGYIDVEARKPLQKNSVYRIASQTKAIVSAGILILQEEGKLLITDPVGKYIPEFMNTTVAVQNENGYDLVKANRPITIRDLLTHTAGIGYGHGVAADRWAEAGIQGWYFADREEPILETIKKIAALPMDAQPGERFVYGYATDILGAVIEVVSGSSLAEFLKQQILDPLEMRNTFFYLPTHMRDKLTIVYSLEDDKLLRAKSGSGMITQGDYVDGPRRSYSGGAGLLSTAIDYAQFLQAVLNDGLWKEHRFLSRKSIELMTANHLNEIPTWTLGTGFGLGFSVNLDLGKRGTLGSVGEYGWGGAYHSSYWVDPAEDLVVVYFTQLIPAGNIDDHAKIRALIYQALE